MAKIDLRNPEERVAAGLSNETVTLPSHHRTGRQSKRSRGDSIMTIVNTVYDAAPKTVTRADIAAALKRTKTPHLIAIIESLVEQGVIVRYEITADNGYLMYTYGAPE